MTPGSSENDKYVLEKLRQSPKPLTIRDLASDRRFDFSSMLRMEQAGMIVWNDGWTLAVKVAQ